MKKLICFILILSSCSAEYHLQKAIKKNPSYGDSTTKTIYHIIDTTIYKIIEVKGDTNEQIKTWEELKKKIYLQFSEVYNDSFTNVTQKLDSVGDLKTKVIRKPFVIHDTTVLKVIDTFYTKCPPAITIQEGYPKFWFWIIITIFVLVIGYLIKK